MARPSEIALISSLLEHEAESVKDLAKAVIKALDEDRAKRESWVVRIRLADRTFGLGPFITEHQALLTTRMMLPGTEDDELLKYVARLVPVSIMQDSIKESNGRYCIKCKHPVLAHNWPKVPFHGCVVGYKTGKPGTGCQCGRVM